MKNRNLLLVFCVTVLVIATAATQIDSGRAGKTDSPGEGNCSGCHSNTPVNTGGGFVSINTNIPSNTYQVGQTYQISVTVNQVNTTLFGFGFEALDSTNANAGTLVITNAAETHLLTASNTRINVVHTLNGGLVTTAGSKTFTFDWTAPATDIGYVKCYVGSVAASPDQDESNDNAYTTFLSISSPTVTAVNEPDAGLKCSIYPNPVKDVLNVYFPAGANSGNMKAELFSAGGMKSTELMQASSGHAASVQLAVPSTLANGVYLLKLQQGNSTAVKKIMIQR